MVEVLIHSVLVLAALVLFVLAGMSYRKDRHPRFRYVLFAFGAVLVRQIYLLYAVVTSGGHGLAPFFDGLDFLALVLFFLAVKS
jgi:H+/Cl- antiporter ClcA